MRGRALAVGGLLLGSLAAAVTAARSMALDSDPWAMFQSFSSYDLAGYGVSALALGVATARRRTAVRITALVLVAAMGGVHASWILPRYIGEDRPADTATFTVLTVNLMLGRADATSLLRAAATADVVVLTEVTTLAVDRLQALGWSKTFPYRSLGDLPRAGSTGTAVFSRFAISETDRVATDSRHENWRIRVQVPQIGDVQIYAVHPERPRAATDVWASEQQMVRDSLNTELPTIVAGDFNAVDDHPSVRRLRAEGFTSATEITGAGWMPTYPALGRIPPLLAIDHILLSRQLTATTTETVRVAGTDHLGLRASVAGTAHST